MAANESNKRWIKPGMEVIHVPTARRMHVMQLLRKKIVRGELVGKSFTDGVLCNWIDSTGEYRSDMFHTNELAPVE
jgi:hypothetical protein